LITGRSHSDGASMPRQASMSVGLPRDGRPDFERLRARAFDPIATFDFL